MRKIILQITRIQNLLSAWIILNKKILESDRVQSDESYNIVNEKYQKVTSFTTKKNILS